MINQKSLFKTILSLAVLGIYSLGKPQTTIAEPAPIFQPIIEEIRNKLPSNLVFRLPSRLPEVVTREMSPKLTFDVNSERAYLALEDENCPSRFSGGGRGSSGGFGGFSEFDCGDHRRRGLGACRGATAAGGGDAA